MRTRFIFLLSLVGITVLLPGISATDGQYIGNEGYFYVNQYRLDTMEQSHLVISNYSEVVIDRVVTDKTFEISDVNRLIIQLSSFNQANRTGFSISNVKHLQVLSNEFVMNNGTLFDLTDISSFEITQNSIFSGSAPILVSNSEGLLNFNYFQLINSSVLQSYKSVTISYQNWIWTEVKGQENFELTDSTHHSIYDRILTADLNITARDNFNQEEKGDNIAITTVNNESTTILLDYGLPSILVDIMGKHQSLLRLYNSTHLLENTEINQTRLGDTSIYSYQFNRSLSDLDQTYDVQIYLRGLFDRSYWFNDTIHLQYKSKNQRIQEIKNNVYGLGTYRCPQDLPDQYCEDNLRPEDYSDTLPLVVTAMSDLDTLQEFFDSPYGVVLGFVGLIMMISKGGQYLNRKQ